MSTDRSRSVPDTLSVAQVRRVARDCHGTRRARSSSLRGLARPKCHGRLRLIAVITEREPARRILAHLGLPTDPLPVARARDPTDDADEAGDAGQLALGLA